MSDRGGTSKKYNVGGGVFSNVVFTSQYFPTSEPTTDPTIEPTHPSSNPSTIPTTGPTTEPTSNPTIQPTRPPSTSPTIDPTRQPTLPSSNPSTSPTTGPTTEPTSNPTIQPTRPPSTSPTIDPTRQPTLPSSNPSTSPSANPTRYPTHPSANPSTSPSRNPSTSPTIVPTHPSMNPVRPSTSQPSATNQTSNPISNASKYPSFALTRYQTSSSTDILSIETTQLTPSPSMYPDGWNSIGYGIISVLLIIPALLLLVSVLYHCTQKGSDPPNYLSIVRCFTNIADLYTDTVFCASLLRQRDGEVILGVLATVFTLVPHLCSIVICLRTLHKWRQRKALRYYVEKYDGLIIGLTAIAGFYPSVDLLSSKLFHLDQTALHIDQAEFYRLKQLRFFNNILLENVPLMGIQLYIIAASRSMDDVSPIIILALVFSSISLTVGVLTMVSRAFANKSAGKGHEQMFCKMTLQSHAFESKHRFIHSIFAEAMALCLGIERSRVETVSIIPILNGITVTVSIKKENKNEQIKLDQKLKDIVSNMTVDAVAYSDDVYDFKTLLTKYLEVKDLHDLKADVEILEMLSDADTHLSDALELGNVRGIEENTIQNSSEVEQLRV
eukprot:235192_1